MAQHLLLQSKRDALNASERCTCYRCEATAVDLYSEEYNNVMCANAFSLALNSNCAYKFFTETLEQCSVLNAYQVFMAVHAYYKGHPPKTSKILHLTETITTKTLQWELTPDHAIFLHERCNLFQIPGIKHKIQKQKELQAHLERSALCSPNHQSLWISRWILARRKLKQLYIESSQRHMHNKRHFSEKISDVLDPSCPLGAFQPQVFLEKLESAETYSYQYIFCQMDIDEFIALAYAWIPSLYATQTRSLFNKILHSHLQADPEKDFLRKAADSAESIMQKYNNSGRTLDEFSALIDATWTLLDQLQATVSKTQWTHSIHLLWEVDSLWQHIENNPGLVAFRERKLCAQPAPASKAKICIQSHLLALYKRRHTYVCQQVHELSTYKHLIHEASYDHIQSQTELFEEDDPADQSILLETTMQLFESYKKNTQKFGEVLAFQVCPLLAQQSSLFKSISLMRCNLLWSFWRTNQHGAEFQNLCTMILDCEAFDFSRALENTPNPFTALHKSKPQNGKHPEGLSPWFMQRESETYQMAPRFAMINKRLLEPLNSLLGNRRLYLA